MVAMHRRRWPLLVGLFVTAVLAYAFHSEVVGRLAYAVEKGKIQASSEELAKVEALSSVFRLVAKTARPSVVQIETVGPVKRPPTEELPDVLRRFLEQHRGIEVPEPAPDPEPERGTGSGVIVDAENGYVVTNNHVVQNAEKIEVRLSDRRRLEADVWRTRDRFHHTLAAAAVRRLAQGIRRRRDDRHGGGSPEGVAIEHRAR